MPPGAEARPAPGACARANGGAPGEGEGGAPPAGGGESRRGTGCWARAWLRTVINNAATCLQWCPVFWNAGQLHCDEMPSPPSWIVVRYGSLSEPLMRAVASD